MEKIELRKNMIKQRQELAPIVRKSKSHAASQHLISLLKKQAVSTFMVYLDFRGELETEEILQWGWQTRKMVTVPVTIPSDRLIFPVQIHSFDNLRTGAYGIREPAFKELDLVSIEAIDAVLIPGVAFDRSGGRLGYGGGYYDRFLPKLRANTLKIGLAFELQITEHVPIEEHDVPLDYVVTEDGVWKSKK